MRITMSSISVLLAAVAGLSLAAGTGCSDDDNNDGTTSGGASGTSGNSSGGTSGNSSGGTSGGTSGAPAEPPVYVVGSEVAAGGGVSTTYVMVTPNLTDELKHENAVLELPASATVSGIPGSKRVFVALSNSAELTAYDLDGAGTGLTESPNKLNFQARGVPNLGGYNSGFYYVSDTKAYWFSTAAGKVVVWNPADMSLTGEMPIPEVVRPVPGAAAGTNYTTSFTGAPIRDGDMLYYFVSWDTRGGGIIKVAAASAIVAINTATDTATFIPDEGSCGYTRDGVISGDYIYIATEAVGTAVNRLDANNGATPCMRRFNKTTQTFDAAWKPDLNALAGGPAGSLVVAPTGEAFIYVLDPAAQLPANANARVVATTNYWHLAKITVGDTPTVAAPSGPLVAASVLPQTLLNNVKVTPNYDPVDNQLREINASGVVATERVSAKLPSNVRSVVQIR